MPAWGEKADGLRPAEIAAVVAHLRRLGGVEAPELARAEPRWVTADAQAGKQLYQRFCAGCHGAEGEGTQAPALNNQVLLAGATDTYLVETIGRGRRGTVMPGFREATPVTPSLDETQIESIVAFLRTWEARKK
jgi:cytochrome c oxidase cbb3-type subunit 3